MGDDLRVVFREFLQKDRGKSILDPAVEDLVSCCQDSDFFVLERPDIQDFFSARRLK